MPIQNLPRALSGVLVRLTLGMVILLRSSAGKGERRRKAPVFVRADNDRGRIRMPKGLTKVGNCGAGYNRKMYRRSKALYSAPNFLALACGPNRAGADRSLGMPVLNDVETS